MLDIILKGPFRWLSSTVHVDHYLVTSKLGRSLCNIDNKKWWKYQFCHLKTCWRVKAHCIPWITSNRKKWCIIIIIICSKLKFDKFFGYFKYKKTTLKCEWQHFEIQNSFWIKINLVPIVRWRRLYKIIVYIVYKFLIVIRSCVYDS
jgi:hypothetical protein